MMIGEQVHSSSGPDSISNHNFSINASNHGGQSQTQSLGRSQGQTVRKRPKASQACASCRKHKTRCELIDSDEPKVDGGNDKDQSSSTSSPAPYARRCHRCTILRLPCSFESGDPLPHSAYSSTKTFPRHPAFKPVPNQQLVQAEHLVPAPQVPYSYMKDPNGHDYTAAPMLAMQSLARIGSGTQPPVDYRRALSGVLSSEQIHYLLEMFESRYNPWACIPPRKHMDMPLVNIISCYVASRHLDSMTQQMVIPQLHNLIRTILSRVTFTPLPSIESIIGVLILSMWAPVHNASSYAKPKDGRLLAATAVSLAMNLRMSQAGQYASRLKEEAKRDKSKEKEVDDVTDMARLWVSTTIVESMLCLGTRRAPVSTRSEEDFAAIEEISYTTVTSARRMRVVLLGKLLDATEQAIKEVQLTYTELDAWSVGIMEFLVKLESLYRLIEPLPLLTEHDRLQFHMMGVVYYACRLLVIHHGLRTSRLTLLSERPDSPEPWYDHRLPNGLQLAFIFGLDAVNTSERILIHTLTAPDRHLLGSAPDCIFAMVAFGAAMLVSARVAMLENSGIVLPGHSDQLLSKIIVQMNAAAYAPDHAPARCAQLVATLMHLWQRRIAAKHVGNASHDGTSRKRDDDAHHQQQQHPQYHQQYQHPQADGHHPPHSASTSPESPDSHHTPHMPPPPSQGYQSHGGREYSNAEPEMHYSYAQPGNAGPGFAGMAQEMSNVGSDMFMDTGLWMSFVDEFAMGPQQAPIGQAHAQALQNQSQMHSHGHGQQQNIGHHQHMPQ